MKRTIQKVMLLAGLCLAATAFGDPDIELVPATCDFGIVETGTTVTSLIEIKNVGDSVLRLDDIFLTGDDAADFEITSYLYLPVFYGAGGSFYVEVAYTASADGNSEAILRILSSDPDESIADLTLLGWIPSAQEEEEEPADLEGQIASIIEFFDQAVEAGELEGVSPFKCKDKHVCKCRNKWFCKCKHFQVKRHWNDDAQLKFYRYELVAAQKCIERGWKLWACAHLRSLYWKTDGSPRPPDSVEGPAAAELAAQIQQLIEALKQN